MEAAKKQPLLNGPLRLFMGTMILANIAGSMHFALLPIYLQHLGANIEQVGLFFTLSAIIPLLMQVIGGWLSDSIGRLQAIAIGSVAGVLSYVIYLVSPRWEWLLLAATAGFITRSFVGPSFQAFVAEQSTEETRGRVYGITEGLFSVVGIIGPPLGGFLSERYSFKVMYAVAGAMYLIAAVIRVWMARDATRTEVTPRERPTFSGLKRSLLEMAGLLAAGGIITWIFISDGVRDIAVNMEQQLRPLYMQNLNGITNTQIGLLASVSSITMMVVMSFGGWLSDKWGERVGIVLGLLIVVFGQAVFLMSQTFWTFAIAWGLFGVGWGFVSPAYDALISKAVPMRLRGTAFGLFSTSIGIVALPAPYIGGLMWRYLGPKAPFLVLPSVMLIMLPIIWVKFRLTKEEEAVSNQQSAVSSEAEAASS